MGDAVDVRGRGLEVSLGRKVNNMEKPLVLLVAVFMMLGFSMVGLAFEHNAPGSLSNWKQLDRIANTEYAGIGAATKIGLASGGEQLSGATCGPGEIYAGEVAWVDPDIHRMMVSGRDGSKIFDLSGIAVESLPEINHFVTVQYTVTNGDRLVSSVNTIRKRDFTALYVGDY